MWKIYVGSMLMFAIGLAMMWIVSPSDPPPEQKQAKKKRQLPNQEQFLKDVEEILDDSEENQK